MVIHTVRTLCDVEVPSVNGGVTEDEEGSALKVAEANVSRSRSSSRNGLDNRVAQVFFVLEVGGDTRKVEVENKLGDETRANHKHESHVTHVHPPHCCLRRVERHREWVI